MLRQLRNSVAQFIAPELRKRRFEAAGGGRRWDHRPTFGNIASETNAAAGTIRSRARNAYANDETARRVTDAFVTACVGSSITATSTYSDSNTAEAVSEYFGRWAEDRADFHGRTNLPGIIASIVRAERIDGEGWALWRGDQIDPFASERVEESDTRNLDGGETVIAGMVHDSEGRWVASMVRPDADGDPLATARPAIRVESSELLHLFSAIGIGQVRGVSPLAPVLLALSEKAQTTDALIVSAKVQAMVCGLLVDLNGTGPAFDGEQSGNILETGLQPGTLQRIPNGLDVRWSNPQQFGQAVEFLEHQIRAIASGLNTPEWIASNSMRNVNYSSARAALIDYRAFIESYQWNQLVPSVLRPIWRRVTAHGVLSGELKFDGNLAELLSAVEFHFTRQELIDPSKDMEGIEKALALGLTSRRAEAARLGYSVSQIDSDIASDREREAALGLKFGAAPKPEAKPAKEDTANE